MDIKGIFDKAENGTLTYDQFVAEAGKVKANFVDLSTGDYVSKNKYTDELQKRDTNIETLTANLKKRDDDLKDVQSKLAKAGDDSSKVADLTKQLSDLQTTYEADKQGLEAKLAKQDYEFKVRNYAATKKFTCKAAQRDFENAMFAAELKVDGDKIIGADDFAKKYQAENEDAFKVEDKTPPAPQFGAPTPGIDKKQPNAFDFNFMGVRAKD